MISNKTTNLIDKQQLQNALPSDHEVCSKSEKNDWTHFLVTSYKNLGLLKP